MTEERFRAYIEGILAAWDDLATDERDRMPDDVWDAIIELRTLVDGWEP